jgi:hypothetical protein
MRKTRMIAIPLRADVLRICTLVAMWAFSVAGHAQTPSPLQEWQYSGGLILERMGELKQTTLKFHRIGGSSAA